MSAPRFIRILLVSFIFLNQVKGRVTNKTLACTNCSHRRTSIPISGDENSIKTGKTLYSTYCTPCHGDKGKGMASLRPDLNPKPANHTSAAIQSETDGSLFYKISEGRNAMPQYKLTLTETQRWSLVNYIRTLAKKPDNNCSPSYLYSHEGGYQNNNYILDNFGDIIAWLLCQLAQQTVTDSALLERINILEKQNLDRNPGEDNFMIVGIGNIRVCFQQNHNNIQW